MVLFDSLEEQHQAYRKKILTLDDGHFERAERNRTQQEKDDRRRARALEQDRENAAVQRAIADNSWVNDGVQAEAPAIATFQGPGRVYVSTSTYTEYQVSTHCVWRHFHPGTQPKKFETSPPCCFDCSRGDQEFPCSQCKARATRTQANVSCRIPCPTGRGILVWTFVRPSQAHREEELAGHDPLLSRMSGTRQGMRQNTTVTRMRSQNAGPSGPVGVLLPPLKVPQSDEHHQSIEGLMSLAEIVDISDIREMPRVYQLFHDDRLRAWKLAVLESALPSEQPTFWVFDPMSTHDDNPAQAREAADEIQRLFPQSCFVLCEQSLWSVPDSSDSRGLSATRAYIVAQLLQDPRPLHLLKTCIIERLCSAAMCALEIERGSPTKPMRASSHPEDMISELATDMGVDRSMQLRCLLRDTQRIVKLLRDLRNVVRDALATEQRLHTRAAQSRVRAIQNILTLFERDIPFYNSAIQEKVRSLPTRK